MAEVVDAELLLEAVGRGTERGAHDPGVVYEHVEAVVVGQESPGKVPHGGQRAQVQLPELQVGRGVPIPDATGRFLVLRRVPRSHDHRRTGGGERTRRLLAQPTGCTGDHHPTTGQVDACQHLVRRGIPVPVAHQRLRSSAPVIASRHRQSTTQADRHQARCAVGHLAARR